MVVKDITLWSFSNKIKERDLKIAIYGVGVIGKVVLPYYLRESGLTDRIVLVVDADRNKQKGSFNIDIGLKIYPVESLNGISSDTIILISGSRYEGMLKTLDELGVTESHDIYIFPEMLLREKKQLHDRYNIERTTERQQIPKKIHYCWFGGNQIPEKLRKCMESWKKICPDYEIVCWSEDNYDVNKNLYTRQAYENKKWAYIPDIARLEILYENGGIYLDTDVEIIKPFDELLYQKGFVGVEKWGIINIGGGCGVIPHHPMIKKILDFRSSIEFINPDGSINTESSGYYETKPFLDSGYKPDNTVQTVDDMTVYSSDFFHPYDYMSKQSEITKNTFSIHHFSESWV